MTQIIRILLVDDHAVVREGIRAVLEDFDEVSVVGEASDGDAALAMLARDDCLGGWGRRRRPTC